MVVGLDLSLTATGVARVGRSPTLMPEGTFTVKSKGKATDGLRQRADRLDNLAFDVRQLVPAGATVIIEQPAYNQTGGSHHDRSGLWWLVVSKLIEHGHEVIEATPQAVKTYATGKGNSSKMEVMAQVIRRYSGFEVNNDNEADALVLAMIGRRLLGIPRDDVPKLNLKALDKLSQVGTVRA